MTEYHEARGMKAYKNSGKEQTKQSLKSNQTKPTLIRKLQTRFYWGKCTITYIGLSGTPFSIQKESITKDKNIFLIKHRQNITIELDLYHKCLYIRMRFLGEETLHISIFMLKMYCVTANDVFYVKWNINE